MEIVSGREVNGAIVHCLELTRELALRGHEVVLVCRKDSWVGRQPIPSGVHVMTSELDRWPTTEIRRLVGEAKQRQIDVVHTHQSRASFFGVLMRLFGGPPVVTTAHNRKIQLHWRWNDQIIAPSKKTRMFHCLFNMCWPSRIDVVHYFVDPQRPDEDARQIRAEVRTELGIASAAPVLVIVGQVNRRKGLLYAVKALPELRKKFPELKMLVVGGEVHHYTARVNKIARSLGVDDTLIWLGARDDVRRLLYASDLMVLPSLEEQTPLSILEAMATGLPVVASKVGGIPECMEHQQEGWLVRPGRIDELSQGIQRMLEDPALRQRISTAARRKAEAEFSRQAQTEQVVRVFEKVRARQTR